MRITLMLLGLAWKNIWRNPSRSALILAAIAIGLFAGTFTIAFIVGWGQATIESEIANNLSYAQVHTPRFNYNSDLMAYFQEDEVREVVDSIAGEGNASYRLKLYGALASAAHTAGVVVRVVDPEEERRVSGIPAVIPDSLGNFLEGGRLPIVIGEQLAKKLNVKLRSKIVLSVQDAEGDMQSVAFRVSGIYSTTNGMFDRSMVFVRRSDQEPLLGLPSGVAHEVGVMAENVKEGEAMTARLKEALPGMEVQGWDELEPALGLGYAWIDLINMIILSIFLVALSFGIVNTMLMAVLERTKELGVLACIGMNKRNIFCMIMFETLCLTFFGSAVGILLALGVVHYTGIHGIDLGFLLDVNYEQMGFSSVVYPILLPRMFVQIVVLVFVVGVLAAVYPARKALRINSWEATKS